MASLVDKIQGRLMRARGNVLRGIAQALLVVAAVSAILVVSVVTYVTFVRVYLPEISQSFNLDFVFATDCTKNPMRQEGLCSFPYANVTFPSSSAVFSRGQAYEVSLTMQLPESEKNLHVGMFLINLSLYDDDGKTHFTAQKSAILRYRSALLRFVDRIIFYPLYVLSFLDETQTVQVELLQGFLDNSYQPTRGLLVQLDTPFVEVYSAKLTIMAQLSGLRYLIYHHSIISAVFGVAACASMFTFIGIISVVAFFIGARRRASSQDVVVYDASSGSITIDGQSSSLASTAGFIRSLSAGASGVQNADVSSSTSDGNSASSKKTD